MNNQQQVKEYYSKQTTAYEQLMVNLVPRYLEQHEIIYNLLPEKDRDYRVLDLGCGNGILSELVFKKLPRAYIVGFDLTDSMLADFSEKLGAHTGQFELKQGDFRSDAIGDNYDIILAGLSLHHLTWNEREEFYRRLYAALNQGDCCWRGTSSLTRMSPSCRSSMLSGRSLWLLAARIRSFGTPGILKKITP